VVVTGHTRACPEGITRATVLELCAANGIDHQVRDLSLTDVYRADEMFCTGTMGELAAITTVDGRRIGAGEPGPVTRRLSDLYRRETTHAGYPVLEVVAGG
jgi:branched-chain amino acid aminotransferase